MDILEKLNLFLHDAVKVSNINDKDITVDFDSPQSVQYSFEWKETLYIFHADYINEESSWLIDFEDEDGNTSVLNSFGASTHSLWSRILFCLQKFVHNYHPKSFYFIGGSNSHDIIYSSDRTKRLIQKETGYKSLEPTLNKHKELVWKYVK